MNNIKRGRTLSWPLTTSEHDPASLLPSSSMTLRENHYHAFGHQINKVCKARSRLSVAGWPCRSDLACEHKIAEVSCLTHGVDSLQYVASQVQKLLSSVGPGESCFCWGTRFCSRVNLLSLLGSELEGLKKATTAPKESGNPGLSPSRNSRRPESDTSKGALIEPVRRFVRVQSTQPGESRGERAGQRGAV